MRSSITPEQVVDVVTAAFLVSQQGMTVADVMKAIPGMSESAARRLLRRAEDSNTLVSRQEARENRGYYSNYTGGMQPVMVYKPTVKHLCTELGAARATLAKATGASS